MLFAGITTHTNAQQIYPPAIQWQWHLSAPVNIDNYAGVYNILNNHYTFTNTDMSNTHHFTEIDSSGNVIWQSIFDTTQNYVQVLGVKKNSHCYFIAANACLSDSTGAGCYFRIQILKVDLSGSVIWNYYYNTNDYLNTFQCMSMDTTDNGGCILSGVCTRYDSVSNVYYNPMLLAVDSLGNTSFQKIFYYDPGVGNGSNGFNIKNINSGYDVVINSSLNHGINFKNYILKVNQNGDSINTFDFGMNPKFIFFDKSKYSNSLMSVGMNIDTMPLVNNCGIIKTDTMPNLDLVYNFDGNQLKSGFTDILSKNDSGYVAVMEGAEYDCGSIICPFTNYSHILLLRVSENGDTIWHKKIGGYLGSSLRYLSLWMTSDGGCVAACIASDSMYGNTGAHLMFIKVGPDSAQNITTNIIQRINILGCSVYPNPATDIVNVQLSDTESKTSFLLYNSIGQLVLQKPLDNKQTKISIKEFSPGIYFYKVYSDQGILDGKVIKN